MPKMKIKEIKKKIKVTEITPEIKQEASEEREVPLEEMASEAPSSRLFPQFNQSPQIAPQEQELPPESQQTAQAESAAPSGPRYAVRNVTEGELRRAYETGESRGSRQQTGKSSLLLAPRETQRESFSDRTLIERPEAEDEGKYDRPMDMKPKKEGRRYPWEA